MTEREFEIWMEGYAATGQSSPAQLIGKATGETFVDACLNFREEKDVMNYNNIKIIIAKGSPLNLDRNADGSLQLDSHGRPRIWACSLFDNEAEARKGFG